jgi:hypothetical protein
LSSQPESNPQSGIDRELRQAQARLKAIRRRDRQATLLNISFSAYIVDLSAHGCDSDPSSLTCRSCQERRAAHRPRVDAGE